MNDFRAKGQIESDLDSKLKAVEVIQNFINGHNIKTIKGVNLVIEQYKEVLEVQVKAYKGDGNE